MTNQIMDALRQVRAGFKDLVNVSGPRVVGYKRMCDDDPVNTSGPRAVAGDFEPVTMGEMEMISGEPLSAAAIEEMVEDGFEIEGLVEFTINWLFPSDAAPRPGGDVDFQPMTLEEMEEIST